MEERSVESEALEELGQFATNMHEVRTTKSKSSIHNYLFLKINTHLDQMNTQVIVLNEKMRNVERKMVGKSLRDCFLNDQPCIF